MGGPGFSASQSASRRRRSGDRFCVPTRAGLCARPFEILIARVSERLSPSFSGPLFGACLRAADPLGRRPPARRRGEADRAPGSSLVPGSVMTESPLRTQVVHQRSYSIDRCGGEQATCMNWPCRRIRSFVPNGGAAERGLTALSTCSLDRTMTWI
jgi:hypothetical protein